MTRRGPVGVLVAALAALLLAGCAVIPTSGVVVQNNPTQAVEDDEAIFYLPNPPEDGADPQQIVRGFVQAASEGGDYAVAKQFLTPAFAATWRPDARVLVHLDSWSTRSRADDSVDLDVPVAAQVDGDGVLAPPLSGPTATLRFGLEQVQGQWRISAGDDGVVLSQPVFLQRFVPTALQFWDPGFARFVPDLRWFPQGTPEERAPSVVRALLAGRAAQLLGTTVSAFPPGTALVRPVRVTGGRTAVALSIPGLDPDREATDRMQQQLAESLQVPTSSVRITANGRTAAVAPEPDLQQPSTQDPVVVAGGRFGTLSRAGLREERDLGPRIIALEPRAVTVSPRQRLAAVLTGDGRIAVVAGDREEPRVVDRRRGLLPATVDQQGWTYSVPAGDPAGLQAASADGTVVPVADLGGSSAVSIEASTDGTRMLVLVRTGTGPVAYVAGIDRDADGTPTGLSRSRFQIAVGADDAVDATWVDGTKVAVLTSGTSVQNVVVQQLGGVSSVLGGLSSARAIVGATSEQNLRALLQSGDLQQRPTTAWQSEFSSPVDVQAIAVQR